MRDQARHRGCGQSVGRGRSSSRCQSRRCRGDRTPVCRIARLRDGSGCRRKARGAGGAIGRASGFGAFGRPLAERPSRSDPRTARVTPRRVGAAGCAGNRGIHRVTVGRRPTVVQSAPRARAGTPTVERPDSRLILRDFSLNPINATVLTHRLLDSRPALTRGFFGGF